MNCPKKFSKKNKKVIAILPVFNEENAVVDLLERMPRNYVDTVLVVNDASTDRSLELSLSKGAIVLSHDERRGAGVSIATGIKYAIENAFDIIVVMAGNGKDDPKQIPFLLKPIVDENYDYVQGSRYLKGGVYGQMPFHRKFATRLYPSLLRIITGFEATDGTNGFRAYKTSIFKNRVSPHLYLGG